MSNSLVSALDTLITDAAPIPFLDLVEPHRAREEEFVAAFRRALRSAAFVGGPEVEGFEREFAAYVGTQHAIGVANGTDSLRFIFLSLGIKPGDEVITASHTFIATSEAISQAGGRPVFVDIDPITMTLRSAAVAAAIGPRTVGIVPVHLYGQTADMDPLLALAAKHHLWIVEDAAQAHGARYRGRSAGTMGVAGSFSFYPGKNLGSVGEGGAVTTNDPRVLEGVRRLREHGQREKYVHVSEGYNGRLHAIQAAVLRIKLQDLDAATAGRQRVARWYQEALGTSGNCRCRRSLRGPNMCGTCMWYAHRYERSCAACSPRRVSARACTTQCLCIVRKPMPISGTPKVRCRSPNAPPLNS